MLDFQIHAQTAERSPRFRGRRERKAKETLQKGEV
jgi:hypothetical protein